MAKTIDELRQEHATHLANMNASDERLADEKITGEEFKAEKAKFDEAEAKLGETAEAIRELNASHEIARDRQDVRAAAAKRREEAAKLEEHLLRRPNQRATPPRELARRNEDLAASREFGASVTVALGAWSNYRAGTAFDISNDQLEACRTVGINAASPELNFNTNGALTEWARQNIKSLVGAFGGENVGPMAGSTDPWDSREGQFAGILNRPPVQIGTLAVNTYSTNGILRAPVTVMTTDHGDPIEQPYFDDMMNTGFKSGESQDITSTAQGKAGKITWDAWKYSSGTIPYSWEAMKRFKYDMPAQIPELLGARLGRVTGTAFTNGLGASGYPQGIIPFARAGVIIGNTATAGKIGVDDIRYLVTNSVDHAKLDNPASCGFMMSRLTYSYLTTTKDGEGRPYFNMSRELVNGRMVFSLEGFPIYINYDFPAITYNAATSQAGTTAILFGDFSQFVVRYAYGSVIPILIRDDVSLISKMQTQFSAVQFVDSRGRNFGNPPLAVLQML